MLDPQDKDLSDDTVFGGALLIRQRRRGYRFNIDALWLVAAARHFAQGSVCDLGAGSGLVGLALGRVPDVSRVFLIERQPGLAQLCRHNAQQLAGQAVVRVEQQDLRQLELKGPIDLVVSNPPYFDSARSRPAHDAEIDQARRTLHGGLGDFARAASRLLAPRGCWVMVLPATSLDAIMTACHLAQLHVSSVRPVHPRGGMPARLILVAACPNKKGPVRQLEPLLEFDTQGIETEAAAALRRSQWLIGSTEKSPVTL